MLKFIGDKKNIRYCILHHFGSLANLPYASTKWITLHDLDEAHRVRWPDFKSRLGYWVGYNAVIFNDGSLIQTRLIGEETAACYGRNFDSIHICLAGNFSKRPDGAPVDIPSQEQIRTLKQVLEWIYEEFGIPPQNFVGHRVFSQTECPGTWIPDDFARKFVLDYMADKFVKLNILVQLYIQLIDLLRKLKLKNKLGAIGRSCPGYVEIK